MKELPTWVSEGLISPEQADRIRAYYRDKAPDGSNRLMITFGALGALLVGLGIILIVAHNWDQLGRTTKTVFAFLPLVIGQVLCGYTLLKKGDSPVWREASATFLFFSVGACISLVGQIYHIPGEVDDLLKVWMGLVFPLAYIMRSSVSSLLFLVGITYYASWVGYTRMGPAEPYLYLLFLLLFLPYYLYLGRSRPGSNFTVFHHWLVPISAIIVLGAFITDFGELITLAYVSLFGAMYHLGSTRYFEEHKLRSNGYLILGVLGTVVVLLVLSFEEVLATMAMEKWLKADPFWGYSPEWISALLLSILALGLWVYRIRTASLRKWEWTGFAFLIFPLLFFLTSYQLWLAHVGINLLVLGIGVYTLWRGTEEDSLWILNMGLLIITALITCRFFDTEISFVWRGIIFVLVGGGFFGANYLLVKKRESDEP